jgi:hypothetical protein
MVFVTPSSGVRGRGGTASADAISGFVRYWPGEEERIIQMTFDPKRHVIKVQGNREYLPVSGRLVWFRSEHPDWGIVTQAVEINLTPDNNKPPYAIFQATIFNADGKVMATATKMEDQRGFGDFIEKAETGSVGRALAYCGYGTQFAPELEESGRFADAPLGGGGMSSNRFAGGNNRPPMGGNGNGFNRSAPPQRPAPAPQPPRNVPPVQEDEDVFGDEPAAPTAAPPQRSAPSPERAEAPPQRPAPPEGGITRVREPERDTFDPGGGDEDDGDDPFADDEMDAAPLAAVPAPARPEKVNALAGNKCSVDGCSNVLTASQMTMSMNKFGKALCLLHQRDAVPAGAAPAVNGNGSGRRTPAKAAPSGTESLL